MGFSGTDAGGFHWEGFNSGAPSQRNKAPRQKKPRRAIGTPFTRVLINLGVTLAVALVYFYAELPPINLKSPDFYVFALVLCAVYFGFALLTSGFQAQGAKEYFTFLKKQCAIPFFLALALLVTALVGSIAGSVILRAGAYAELLPFETGDFTSDVAEISYDQIPMLDRDSAERLGAGSWGSSATWSASLR